MEPGLHATLPTLQFLCKNNVYEHVDAMRLTHDAPRARQSSSPLHEGDERRAAMPDRSTIVLVVDDETDFLDLFAKRFSKRGFTVATADSGPSALRYLADNPVDVVVLDVKMPRMNGIEVLKEIKRLHPLVEVIMLTGHGSVESGLQGISHGAFDYVMKPFQLNEMIGRIEKAHEHRLKQLDESST